MYVFDTDTLSNLLKRTPSPALERRLGLVPVRQRYVSSISVGELLFGAHRKKPRSEMLFQNIERLLSLPLVILPFDTTAARIYAPMRADLERLGTPLDEADLRIAAITLAHGFTVVTANVRHFGRIPGLPVENWLGEA